MPRDETFDKPLPSSPDTERAALCSVLLDNSLAEEAIASWSLEDFYVALNRDILAVMIELHREQMPFDMIVVADRLRARGRGDQMIYLSQLLDSQARPSNLKAYTRELKENTSLRWAVKEGARITAAAFDREESQSIFSAASERIGARRDVNLNGHKGGQLIDLAREVTDHLYTIRAGINTAVPTGLADLDRLTAGGIRPGELWGIAARSSRGKSSVLVQMLLNMAKRGQSVVLFSLETQALSVALRILAAELNIPMNSLRAPGALRASEIDEIVRQVEEKFRVPFWIYTKGFKSIVEIKRKIHSLKPSVVGIDWYGKLEAGDSSRFRGQRTQELKYIADFLQQDIAITEEVGLLVPAQFNRSGWSAQEPGPGNVDGGEAYHDACDLFAVLNTEPTVVKGMSGSNLSKATLKVYKQRNGPVALGKDAIHMMFDRTRMQFFPRAQDAGEEVPDTVSPTGYIPDEKERKDFL